MSDEEMQDGGSVEQQRKLENFLGAIGSQRAWVRDRFALLMRSEIDIRQRIVLHYGCEERQDDLSLVLRTFFRDCFVDAVVDVFRDDISYFKTEDFLGE